MAIRQIRASLPARLGFSRSSPRLNFGLFQVVQPRTTAFQFGTKNATNGVKRWLANPQVGCLNHGRDFTLNSGFAVQTNGVTSQHHKFDHHPFKKLTAAVLKGPVGNRASIADRRQGNALAIPLEGRRNIH